LLIRLNQKNKSVQLIHVRWFKDFGRQQKNLFKQTKKAKRQQGSDRFAVPEGHKGHFDPN